MSINYKVFSLKFKSVTAYFIPIPGAALVAARREGL